MANRHFGKVADVFKHLLLVEILAVDRPTAYGETHAGSAGYRLVDDGERRFGVVHFLEASAESPQLVRCRYRAHLADLVSGGADTVVCPGSPLLAMRELGRSARHVYCDLDPDSVADIAHWAASLGLGDRVDAVAGDGMSTIATRFLDVGATSRTLVHIDPYDPHACEPGGRSALDIAAQLASPARRRARGRIRRCNAARRHDRRVAAHHRPVAPPTRIGPREPSRADPDGVRVRKRLDSVERSRSGRLQVLRAATAYTGMAADRRDGTAGHGSACPDVMAPTATAPAIRLGGRGAPLGCVRRGPTI